MSSDYYGGIAGDLADDDTMTGTAIIEDEIKEDEINLRRVTLYLCVLCLNGAGGECHSPGCALWINRAPDIPVNVIEGLYYSFTRDELIDAISTLEAHVAASGPLAGKILADSMADAIIRALCEHPDEPGKAADEE